MTDPREVVVTGIGLMTPLGATLADIAAKCYAKASNFGPITLFETGGSPIKFAGEHAAPDGKLLPDRKSAKVLSRRDQTSVLAAQTAFKQAGLDSGTYAPDRLGMYVGSSCTHLGDLTPYLPLVAKHADMANGTFDSAAFGREFMETLNPIVVLRLLMNNALCFGTIGLAIKGVNSNYMQHEPSGLRAIGEGYIAIRSGRADAVLAGGTAQPVEPFQIYEARHMGLLADQSHQSFAARSAIKPYDREAAGTVLSEGTAFLVLEDGEKARARGAKILGKILGFGIAADVEPDDDAAPGTPSGGLVRAAQAAMGEDVSAPGGVIGSGSGVSISDQREALAYTTWLGKRVTHVPLCSVKSVLGETCEAHGPIGVALALAALEKGMLPPTANFRSPLVGAETLRVVAASQPIGRPRIAVVSRSRLGTSAVILVGN